MYITGIDSGKTTCIELREVKDGFIVGGDILPDVIGNWLAWMEQVERDRDFVAMHDEDAEWWIQWARNEQAIYFARDAADGDTVAEDERIIAEYGYDMELLQAKELELFGLD